MVRPDGSSLSCITQLGGVRCRAVGRGAARRSRRRLMVVPITTAAVFMGMLDATIVNLAFPSIARSFPSASTADLSWVISAYNLVLASLLIPAGRAADRYGRKRAWAAGLVVFLVASGACAAAPSLGV